MYIVDLYGKRIEVTNKKAAIAQAKAFVGYCHEGEDFKLLDEQLKKYWEDILEKLKAI